VKTVAIRSLVWIVLLAGAVLAQEQTQAVPVVPEVVVYGCPIHAEVQSKVPGKCHKCNTLLLAIKPGGEEGFFTCPMHADVQSAKAGTCPKCKMNLIKAAPPETGEYIVRMETAPRAVKAREKVTLRFSIFHPDKEEQVKEFGILHDMPFHLFVVSQDLEHFDHIHPAKQPDGSFVIDTVLPRPGYYKIFCDYFPVGGSPQVTQLSLVTSNFPGDLISSLSKLQPDQTLSKTLEGTRFDLTLGPEKPFAGKSAELHYKLTDEKSGAPVKDLKPYLGAWGHTLILSEDGTDYLHSHPIEMIPEDVDRSKVTGGPEVVFDTFFPHPGNYRIWSQFLRGEKLITVSFTVNVPRLQ
jgi:hypothetical protein